MKWISRAETEWINITEKRNPSTPCYVFVWREREEIDICEWQPFENIPNRPLDFPNGSWYSISSEKEIHDVIKWIPIMWPKAPLRKAKKKTNEFEHSRSEDEMD